MTLLVVGQSHVGAIRAAHAARRMTGGRFPRTRGLHTLEPRLLPEIVADEARPEGFRFGDTLAAEIEQEIETYRPRLASMIGGNAHAALALVRHPRAYDFRLPGEEGGPPFDLGAEPVPEALVRAALAERLANDLLRMRLLRALIGPFVQIESPPPVRDGGIIVERADPFFREQGIAALGVAPPGLRWRMWRLSATLVRSAAEAMHCRYMPVPEDAFDAAGFLRPDLAADATHGTAEYGELVLRAVEALPA